jgi:hypothetical protein
MQTKFEDEGNCFAACLSSLFGVQITDVEYIVDGETGWLQRFEAWLNVRGLTFAFVTADAHRLPDTLYIACGFTETRPQYHAVIYRADTLVHDPHPDGAGLSEVTERIFILTKESENIP